MLFAAYLDSRFRGNDDSAFLAVKNLPLKVGLRPAFSAVFLIEDQDRARLIWPEVTATSSVASSQAVCSEDSRPCISISLYANIIQPPDILEDNVPCDISRNTGEIFVDDFQ